MDREEGMLPKPGEEFDLGCWESGPEFVKAYLGAVDDGSSIYRDLGVVPPMVLAALALAALLKKLDLPPGTIHASQELDCRRTVNLGEQVSCKAKLSRPIRRGAWRFISADFAVHGAEGEAILTGKTSVLVPAGEPEGG